MALEESDEIVIQQMSRIASKYSPKGKTDEALLQSFHSFRQALNVASADQRLLVVVNASKSEAKKVEDKLKPVFADSSIMGKFHLHFVNTDSDKNWSKVIKGDKSQAGVVIVRAGKFGTDGVAMEQLPISSIGSELKTAMLKANQEFAKLEERKTYESHVRQGRRQGIRFENEIKGGEDRGARGEAGKRNGKQGKGKQRNGKR